MIATTGAVSIFGLLPGAAAAITFRPASSPMTKLIRIGQRFEAEGANPAMS